MPGLDIERDINAISGADPEQVANRFFQCPVCGQQVDREHMGQMYHHSDAHHEPLPDDTNPV